MTNKEITKRQEGSVENKERTSSIGPRRHALTPLVDVLENDDEYLVVADVPGVKPGEVDIRLEDGELTLRAPRTSEVPSVELVSGERGGFEYVRSFRIPGGIAGDKISAELNQGTLKLHLPKAEAMKPRQIQVAVS
jgi:HSP20 family molecular chaperone IbpA